MRKLSAFLVFSLLFNTICESAFARAGGRSSFSGGRSSTSYSSQGSRGSRTFEGGGGNGKNYAPMQRSATQNQNQAGKGAAANPQNPQTPPQPNFFQRNPLLSTFGTVLAASWLGHMLFGGSSFGAGQAGGAGGFFMNMILMALAATAVMFLVRRFTRGSSCSSTGSVGNGAAPSDFGAQQNSFNQAAVSNISLPEFEKSKFQQLLIDVQNAWSSQDMEALKKLITPEMTKYFADSLAQNVSQGIANKVEDVDVTSIDVTESWREGEMEYATAIIEWSAYDYMVNLNKNPQDHDYIVEGGNKNLVMTSEAWTFTRFGSNGKWILSAIAQVE